MGTEISKDASTPVGAAAGPSNGSGVSAGAGSVDDLKQRQREISMADNAVRSKARAAQNYTMKIIIR